MMKKLLLLAFLFCACNLQAQNLILNGSFENNTSLSPASSLSNAQYNTTVTSSSSFGQTIIVNSDGDIDLFKTGGVLLLGQLLGSKSTRRRLVYCSRCKRL